ncbi:hypothetical protein BJ165DRAFT_1615877 [Panaeolus papilionaceus]|nr:hypothetical protein BJ165DRAFT_1615877 [Panaeolus papilionaceus]
MSPKPLFATPTSTLIVQRSFSACLMRPFNESFPYTRLSSPIEDSPRFDHSLYGSICASYMIYLFASTKYLYPSPLSAWQDHLPIFIASVLQHSGLDLPVLTIAMTYLCKYKEANIFSVAYDDDAYRLFFASYTIAAQVSSGRNDDLRRHHLAPWSRIASGGRWDDDELLIMQASFRSALKGDLCVDPDLYIIFQKIFKVGIRTSSPRSTASQYLQPRMPSSSKGHAPVTPPPLYEETLARSKALCASPISPARTASELEEEDHQILASLFFTSASAYPSRKICRPSIKQRFARLVRRLDPRPSSRNTKVQLI